MEPTLGSMYAAAKRAIPRRHILDEKYARYEDFGVDRNLMLPTKRKKESRIKRLALILFRSLFKNGGKPLLR